MKRLFALTAAAAALLLLTDCSIRMNATPGAGRVIVSAGRAHSHPHHVALHSVSNAPAAARNQVHTTKPQHPRATASRFARARDLSAANDIDSMTFTLINTRTNTVIDNENIDPGYPFIDLYLTPGGTYRIIIDVDIKAGAPGTNVGVTRYGDQADFTVDYNYDTFVDLSVHPTASLVFDPASVGGSPATVQVYDPSNMSTPPTDWNLFQTALTASANDKFFYGIDASLYYFNKNKNAIYSWKNIGTSSVQLPIDGVGDKILDGATLGTNWNRPSTGVINLWAACADPWDPVTIWVIGYDVDVDTWYYYAVDISDPANPYVWDYNDITPGMTDESGEPVDRVPTAIAVDSTWNDIYVSYYSHVTTSDNIYSGMLQYYGGGIYASYPDDYADFLISGPSQSVSSILTDVVWDQGKAWVTASPIAAVFGAASANTGTADLLTFDDFMNPLATLNLMQVYAPGSLAVSSATNKLVIPNRFAGPLQGNKVFISQADFQDVSTHVLSLVDLAPTIPTVTSY